MLLHFTAICILITLSIVSILSSLGIVIEFVHIVVSIAHSHIAHVFIISHCFLNVRSSQKDNVTSPQVFDPVEIYYFIINMSDKKAQEAKIDCNRRKNKQ